MTAPTAFGQVGINPAEAHPGRVKIDLDKAQVLGTVMYVAAHPDDENTALLSYLALGRKYRTIYLSITRGDGGQNLIGTEQGEQLGVIRTHELLQARRIDGAEQLFTRAVDFGFCKSPEEAFAMWNHDSVLADVVWAIRNTRPDVIICRFPTDGSGGHGHHTASAILAEEAFDAAADPKRFSEQLAYVSTWQVKRLFWNSWTPGTRPGQPNSSPPPADWLRVDVGEYNPQLGMSYTEMAGLSRSQHKSQGFGAPQRRGQRWDYLKLIKGAAATTDLIEGVETSFARLGSSYQAAALALAEAAVQYSPSAPERSRAALAKAHSLLTGSDPWVAITRHRIERLLLKLSGFYAEATAQSPTAASGRLATATLTAVHRHAGPLTLEGLGAVAPNQLATAERPVTLAALPTTTPYWLQNEGKLGRFGPADPRWLGLPETPIQGLATLHTSVTIEGIPIALQLPVRYKWVDPVNGDRYRPLEIGPAVVARFEEKSFVFTNGERPLSVRLTAHASASTGTLRLKLPAGWKCEPAQLSFTLGATDADTVLSFRVRPSPSASVGEVSAEIDGSPALERIRIQYDHIPYQALFRSTSAKLVPLQVACAARRVGYVMGAGDEVPAALRQLGLTVDLLSDEQLLDADPTTLARYDAVVVGVRAYNTRAAAKNWVPRLTRYAESGGTVVVQYQTTASLLTPTLGPYPFALSRERITDENAALRRTADHPSLTSPNRITDADFAGWVQERGLYFATAIDPRYATPLEGNDPGEAASRGMLLIASVGKGSFVYTGLAFFRQLPAGVPGAYRLFANLLSLKGTAGGNGKPGGSN